MGCLKLAYYENPSPLKVVQGGSKKSAKVVQRFLSVDPLTQSYPHYTPYSFAGNRPVTFIDLDGAEDHLDNVTTREDMALLSGKLSAERYRANQFARGVGGLMGAAAVLDVFVTKGKASQFIFGSIVLGHFYHNGTNNPLEQKRRDNELKNDAVNLLMGYGIGKVIGGIFKVVLPTKPINVELMGGPESKLSNFINFDTKAVAGGINDEVKNFSKYFGTNTVSEMVVNNPQAEFLTEVSSSLKSGATITVRGTASNKFFKPILDGKAEGLEDFIVTEQKSTQTTGFFRTDGTPIKGAIRQMKLVKR